MMAPKTFIASRPLITSAALRHHKTEGVDEFHVVRRQRRKRAHLTSIPSADELCDDLPDVILVHMTRSVTPACCSSNTQRMTAVTRPIFPNKASLQQVWIRRSTIGN
jgi:hypothetical protein